MSFKRIKSLVLTLLAVALLMVPPPQVTVAQETPKKEPIIGLAYLPLLHPKFPVRKAIKLLKNSKDKKFSFVYGPFGRDTKNYDKMMTEVPSAKVMIYGLCGPCRIPRRSGKTEWFHRELTIPGLNRKLPKSKSLQSDLKKYFKGIRRKYVDRYPGTQFEFVPELESNMDVKAESVAINIAYEVFGDLDNVTLRLNPINRRRTGKIPTEVHVISLSVLKTLKRGDSVSLDGINPSYKEIEEAIKYCKEHGIDFYLWRPEWQGSLTPGARPGKDIHPDDRVYVIKDFATLVRLLNL